MIVGAESLDFFSTVNTLAAHTELSVVVLVEECGVSNLGKGLSVEQGKKVPSTLKGSENITLLVLALGKELVFELLKEEKVVLVISSQSVLTDDGLHGKCILTNGVEVVKLIGN
jgi:hypothetical protein